MCTSPKKFKPWKILTVVGRITVIGVLTHCILLHSVSDLKTAQMNMQCSLIREHILYEFKKCHYAIKSTKNIFCVKGKVTVGYSTVTRFKSCRNLNDQAKSGRTKTGDSEAMFQARQANPANITESIKQVWHLTVLCDLSPS